MLHDAERTQDPGWHRSNRQVPGETFDLAHHHDAVPVQVALQHLPFRKLAGWERGKLKAHPAIVARQTVGMRVPRTFAFVDLSGFTRFTDLHGDDEAVAVLTQFRYAVRSIASDVGVRIAKWLGDGAMLVAVEGPALVRAVVELERTFNDDGLLPVRAGPGVG